MDKSQAVHNFWSGFSIPAYDENSVPGDAALPYITYSVATDSLGNPVALTGSVWYKSTSWEAASRKADEIAEGIGSHKVIALDNGYLYLTKGTPFTQRMPDPDDTIKRIYINIMAEYLTAN